ncbi:MAG: GntR family transcriptional regulator [Ardenticatenaceae bacterium]|nr:GntR family transcriptional regulator [Ardenticatenaceae bacterium]HBY93248.1 GntR family transcriptional regulator [Chloroflexota bacterium]
MASFDPMAPRTLRENVTDLLRRAIIDGSLAPGTELNQAQIAEKLGISRGPVREALGQLEQEGLIRNVPYKGVYVTPLNKKYVEELYSMRGALETFALTRSLERAQPADIEWLNNIVEEMRRAGQERDAERLVQLDLAFHDYLVGMADHELLYKMWKLLEIGVRRCLHARHKIYQTLEEVVGSHPALVDAIAEHDIGRASQLLGEHITEAGEQICQLWSITEPADDETETEAVETAGRAAD